MITASEAMMKSDIKLTLSGSAVRRALCALAVALALTGCSPANRSSAVTPGNAVDAAARSGLNAQGRGEDAGSLGAGQLIPGAAGAPRSSFSIRTPTASGATSLTPSNVLPIPSENQATVRGYTPQPRATVAASDVSADDAQSLLAAAIKPLKGRTVRVTQAAGYEGDLYLAVPTGLQEILGAAVSGGGSACYGLYNAVNEAITIQANGNGASGALTALVEPKSAMPASAAAAAELLIALFPGITASLAPVQGTLPGVATAYLFYGVSGATAYSAGFVSYDDVPLAFVMTGSGSYQSMVVQSWQ